ncbi:MAG: response regulator [Rhodospirillales bacterium]|nr:response regulator [Rhodospirillales bacterium]MCW9002966.1 response regulator [Rhodospirillales bacterium]MCW9040662.1 response regulator [Rhodospirillales bacterium]
MKVILADDHPLVRAGVATVIERLDDHVKVVEAQDYNELLSLVRSETGVGLVIADLNMPGMDPLDGLRAVRASLPDTPLVVFSASEDSGMIRQTLECGVSGYIFKSSGSDVMLEALRLTLSGETYRPHGGEAGAADTAANSERTGNAMDGDEGGFGLAALNRLPYGVLVIDKDYRAVFMNRIAAEIMACGDGIEVGVTGVCRTSVVCETHELHRLIDSAISGKSLEYAAMSLSRPSMLRPLSVLVSPIGSSGYASAGKKAAALVFITDPESQTAPAADVLQRLYALTEAEARVVQALVGGKRLESAAEEFGVSMNTVRTHLKQAFRKTGTNRQSELVKLVLTGPAAMAAGSVPLTGVEF